MDQQEPSVNCPVGSIVPVGCSHPDSMALSILKDKDEKNNETRDSGFLSQKCVLTN